MSEYDYVLRDDRPAADWAEGFPLGSGRIGAMVSGAPMTERISLNHDLLWRSAYKGPYARTGRDIDKLRALAAEKRWDDVDALLQETLPAGRGIYINPFVPLGDMYLTMRPEQGGAEDYVRELDLRRGVARVGFSMGGVRYGRESFCSYKYGLFVTRLTASRPVSLCGEVSLSRQTDPECAVTGSAAGDRLVLCGAFLEGRRFAAVTRVLARGGRVIPGRTRYDEQAPAGDMAGRHFGLQYVFDRDKNRDPARGPSLIFDSCDEVVLLTALATDREAADPEAFASDLIAAAACVPFEGLLSAHERDFSARFDRTRLILTDRRCVSLRELLDRGETASPAMIEALYNVSRYLAVASGMPQPLGRVPKAPINLQGLWNADTWPAWESDYHTDLNVQMCYWPLAQAGLGDYCEPFVEWMKRLLPQAKERARDLYGAPGAAFNGCCDPWTLGGTDTVGYGFLAAGAWLAQILWIYYEHCPSGALLRRVYDLMAPIAEFNRSMLREDPDGRLSYPFGSSPEMGMVTASGGVRWVGPCSACDLLLTRELFEHMARAEAALGVAGGGKAWRDLSDRVASPLRDGRIGEWIEEQKESEPGHRHRSPFIAFCPGSSVPRGKTPELAGALEALLDRRLKSGSSLSAAFSYTWDAQILARLGRGGVALALIQKLASVHLLPNGLLTINDYAGKGGLSWFSGVRVFQIEASIGLLAALGEFFYQDQEGFAQLLPACPEGLRDGALYGVRSRGGFVVDLVWRGGKLKTLRVTAPQGGVYSLRAPGHALADENGLIRLDLAAGETREVAF